MAIINLGRVGYVHKGAYSPSAVYEKYDVVLYDHGSYLYIGESGSGHTPTDTAYWQAMLDPAEMNAATEAAVQAAAEIRDRMVSMASPFTATGNPVSCHPVKGLPLQVISHLAPAQEGEGTPSPSNIRKLLPLSSCSFRLGEQEYTSEFTKSVYGGDYNWESGKNKATARYMELDGTETGWDLNANGDTSYFVRYFSSGIKGEENRAFMSHFRNYPELAYSNAAGTYNVFRWQNHSSGVTRLCIRPDLTGYDVTDVNGSLARWSAYLAAQKAAGTPVQIVYFVTDGEEEAIASGQEILALEGENMLSADAGTLTVSGPMNPAWQNEQQDERIGALEDGAIEGGGNPGEDGGYYTPNVDNLGYLTWDASKANMPEVEGVNIKGPKGDEGKTPVKGVDYFDGKDGTSVTVQSVSESSADGGINTVTFSDGKAVSIKNGGKGSDGFSPVVSVQDVSGGHKVTITDRDGAKTFDVMDGKDGKDGISTTHSWSGTTLTITSASGTSSANLIGPAGDDGKTPVKGTDYFTAADKSEMVTQVKNSLGYTSETWTFTMKNGSTITKKVVLT